MSTTNEMALGPALRNPLTKAILCSCVVYIAPVSYLDFGFRFWCFALLALARNDPFAVCVWLAYFAWTLVFQGMIAGCLYLLFCWASRRIWMLAATVFLFITVGTPLSLVAVWLDARAVPAWYRSPEGGAIDWEEECRIDHAHLLSPVSPRYASLARLSRAWLVSHAEHEPMLIQPEGCRVTAYPIRAAGRQDLETAFEQRPKFDVQWEHTGFRYRLFQQNLESYSERTWTSEHGFQLTPTNIMFQRRYSPGGCLTFDLVRPSLREVASESLAGCPLLIGDSEMLGFLEESTFSIDRRIVKIGPSRDVRPLEVDISRLGPGFVTLEDSSVQQQKLLLTRESSGLLQVQAGDLQQRGYTYEFAESTFDGQITWRLPRVGDKDHSRLLLDSPNWIWWQTGDRRVAECCTVEWNLSGRAGKHEVARGRSIVSASLSPAGDLIAISVSDLHQTGKVQDAVYVIRIADGTEVFRRYLPPLAESRVQFLGASFLAYTDFDGSDGFVRVIRVPPT